MHLTVDIGKKNVLIIGDPATGKTHLANLLKKDNPGHKLIHTDDFIEHGYKQSLYVLLSFLTNITRPTIIEGILGYRLLRKGLERECYYPDIVIEVVTPEATRIREYKENRPGKNWGYIKTFNAAHNTILADYKSKANPHPPEWHTIKNDY